MRLRRWQEIVLSVLSLILVGIFAAKRTNGWIYAFPFSLGSLSVVYGFNRGWRTLLGISKAKRQQETTMQQELSYAYGGSPVLLAFEGDDGKWIAWCPFCAKFHWHRPGEGERTAHCKEFDSSTGEPLPDQSVFRHRGYVLRYAGKATKKMLKLAREEVQKGGKAAMHQYQR